MSEEALHGSGVSRRQYLAVTGATGGLLGFAGCTGGTGDGDGSTSESTNAPIDTEPPDEQVTVQLATDSNFKNSADAIVQTLRENGGLSENVDIEFVAGSFESGDRQAKYQQLLNAGEKNPTILMVDNGWAIPFIARNQLQNLSQSLPDSIVSTVKDRCFESMIATTTGANGDLYGVPLFADFPTIQYRKDLMREAGYSDSDFETWATEPMKWTKFSEVVKQTADQTGKQGFNWQGKAYVGLSCCDYVEFMGSWGGSYFGAFENLFGPIGDRPVTVDEESVVNSLRMMRTFIHGSSDEVALDGYQQISPGNVVSYTEEPSRTPFTEGKVVALRNWPYSININASEENFGEDLGAMPIPYHTPASESKYGPQIGGSTSALGGWHLALNPNSPAKKKQAAVQVFKALQNDQVRLDLFEIGGWIPPIPELVNSSDARELETIGRYVDTLKVAGENSVPRPVTPVWPQQSTKIAKEVNASLRQEKTPSEAMSTLKESLVAIEKQASQ